MQAFYQIALTTHIIGLATMAGVTLVDYLIIKEFWKQYTTDKSKAITIHEARSKFPILFAVGITLLILSGVTMMGITKGAFGAQIWFKIKFVLVVLIIINGIVVGSRQSSKLTKLLSKETSGEKLKVDILKVRKVINWFHLSQITFFAIIFTLSVFKFN
jgi:uncharacterized membrane protein SirB2